MSKFIALLRCFLNIFVWNKRVSRLCIATIRRNKIWFKELLPHSCRGRVPWPRSWPPPTIRHRSSSRRKWSNPRRRSARPLCQPRSRRWRSHARWSSSGPSEEHSGCRSEKILIWVKKKIMIVWIKQFENYLEATKDFRTDLAGLLIKSGLMFCLN